MEVESLPGCLGERIPIAPNCCSCCTAREICDHVRQKFVLKTEVKKLIHEAKAALRGEV